MDIMLMPWVLVVQLWTDPPPKMKFIYSKVYQNYADCMEARREWDNKGLIAICGVKNEISKDGQENMVGDKRKTTP